MEQENPFEALISKMCDLMDLIQKHKGPVTIMPRETAEEIDRLEEELNRLEEHVRLIIKDRPIDPKMLRIMAMQSDLVSDKDKRLIERTKMLERDAKALKTELDKVIKSKGKESSKASGKHDEKRKQEIKERRKLFKSIGGDKNWIPL